jgi:hypothetical protein
MANLIGQQMLTAMLAAIKTAKAAQASPFAGITGVPSGGAIGPGAAAAQAFARSILWAYGWGPGQFPPLQALWNQESGWRWNALNPASGAYGIPQSLPASKMAAAGPDWQTNPATQIRWGLGYIKATYGSPAGAWAHEVAHNWYDSGGILPAKSVAINTTPGPEVVLTKNQWTDLHDLLTAFVRDARRREEPAWLTRWVRSSDNQLSALARAHQQIAAQITAAKGFAATQQQSLNQYAGLAGSAAYTAPAAVTGQQITAGFQAKLQRVRDFGTAIRRLQQHHLNRALIGQIIAMGPDDGLAYAQAILSEPQAAGILNVTEAAIGRASAATARTAADVMFDTGKNASRGFLTGLVSQESAIDKAMRQLAARMIRSLRHALGIHSPARALMPVGEMSFAGFAAGWAGAQDKAAWSLAVPPVTGGRPGGGAAVTHTYNINVRVDPVVAAATPSPVLGRHIAEHVTAHIRSGGRLYPSGTKPR